MLGREVEVEVEVPVKLDSVEGEDVSIIRDYMKGLGIVLTYQTHEMTLKSWP